MGVRWRKVERGAAAVEFALLVPVLVLILLGTIDWGYFFYVEQVVTNAAREGARVGSLTPYAAGNPAADATAAQNAGAAVTNYLGGGGLDAARASVTVNPVSLDPMGNFQILVSITYTTGSITGFTALANLMPAAAQAQVMMRR